MNVSVIADVTFDHIAKEIDSISGGSIACTFSYEEDIIGKLLAISADDLKDADVLFIHSDQVFHRRPAEWQKAYLNVILRLSAKISSKKILVSNSISNGFKTPPAKLSFGKGFYTGSLFSNEISALLDRPNVFAFDFQLLLAYIGETSFYNFNVGHMYQMPYTNKAVKAIAQAINEQLNWLFSEEKKVIVVDCDNTLWKGIIGEDGIKGVFCDKDAEGIVHYHFQEFLKLKKEEGFLLCICSKNNEADVKEAFAKKNFVLKWEDFIIKKINWSDKITNIREIGAELNVGTDSFIFIDDNKFEVDLVSSGVKNITSIEFTGDYNDFLNLVNRFEFKKKQILKADLENTEQYIKQQQRNSEESQFENIDEFIKSLNIKLEIRLNDMDDLERLAQMTGKTNQFNFNKQEYSTEQLKQLIAKEGRVYSLKVSDKFGDYGTVGLILINQGKDKEVILENFLMSCRALGKKIEDTFLNAVLNELRENALQITSVKVIKTEKNIPAENFYNKIKNETDYFRTTTTIL